MRLTLALLLVVLVSCNQKKTLFSILPSSKTNIDFVNKVESKPHLNLLYYLYFYNGGGVATGDINNDGLPDIYFTANSLGNNKLYLNKGNFQFEDITEKAGVAGISDWCSGVTMADINGDGLLDIYVCSIAKYLGLNGRNLLYINNGNGSFTESAQKYGLDFSGLSTQAAFFDYDHDGDLDCYLLNQSYHPHSNVVDTANRRSYDPLSGDVFFRNDISTTGKFTDVSKLAGIYQSKLGYGLGLAVGDVNNDGWDDIYIGNDFHENDYYYINNGNGSFTESGAKHFGHYSRFSMGNDMADYNNDGQLDIITVDMLPDDEKILKTYGSDENPDIYKVKLEANGYQNQYSKNCLQKNNGNGSSFSEVSFLAGVPATDWSWCPLFADFDNDGNKDLFISSGIVKRPVDLDYVRFISDLSMKKGMDQTDKFDQEALDKMPDGAYHPFFYKGDGDLRFTNMSNDWGTGSLKGYYNGSAYADLDNDGDLDVVVNAINEKAVIMKNGTAKSNYLSLTFKGDGANTKGIGAKAYIYQKGKMQYQQAMATRGFQSASDTRIHFGLNGNATVDSIVIVWPDQRYQVVRNVAGNKNLLIEQKNATGRFDYNNYFRQPAELLSAINTVKVDWQHKENPFEDYNVQYLIPHCESTRGPKVAVADVNGDGLDDMYTCGAHGQSGSLMLQQPGGSFNEVDKELWQADAASEDVDALFFDANGDGRKDLYVVSGGNQLNGTNPALLDRLYINDGKGHFTKSTNSLPQIFGNKSCVASADVDGDGDTDLFVGTLADPRAYGVPQTSYLLINNGKGQFTPAPANQVGLTNIGMVTSAAFADLNKDGQQDLVIAGEWMPLTVFINNKGTFKPAAIPASTGWWQTVYIDDVNGDGNLDILAGNWGWNNKFWSGKNGPVRLYVSDFDKNGQVDQLMSYTMNGKEYPFLAKDEVERSLPVLKKHYLQYSDFAGLEMKDAYYGFAEQVTPLKAERLGSVLCLGDGKGGFTIKDLPIHLQAAPIFTFQKVVTNNSGSYYLAGGNFYESIPYEGRYDAQALALFLIDRRGEIRPVNQPMLADVREEVRDIKWLKSTGGQSLLTVAGNNTGLLFYNLHQQ